MKKFALVCVVSVLAFSVFASDLRSDAIGGLQTPYTGTSSVVFKNPATVAFFNQYNKFTASVMFGSDFNSSKLKSTDSDFFAKFSGKSIAISLESSKKAENLGLEEDAYNYSMLQNISADLSLSKKFSIVSLGLGINISTKKNRDNKIYESNKLGDYISQVYFATYSKIRESDSLKARFGLVVGNDRINGGVLLDEFFVYDATSVRFNFENFDDNLSCGLYYNTDMYTERGKLKLVSFGVGAEVKKLISSDSSLAVGTEFSFNLARNKSIAVRSGFDYPFNGDNSAEVTLGAGFTFESIKVDLAFDFEKKKNTGLNICVSLNI